MSYVIQGTTTNLFATFQDVEGVETAATTPTVTVIHVDAAGDTITDVNAAAMTLISGTTGQYFYAWDVASDAYEGSYLVTYSGTVTGKVVTATESITVLDSGTTPGVSTTYYATTLQIARFAGIGVEVQKETLGTGDGAEDSYDTKFGSIVAESYLITFGASGSNDLTELSETNDYVLSKDDGRILLTGTGVTKVDGSTIYIDYTYSPKQSDTILASYLPMSSAEADKLTNNYWGEVKSSTQHFDGASDGYVHTDRPFGTQVMQQPEFELRWSSVQTITSVEFLDNTGAVQNDIDAEYIRLITDDEYQDGRVIITAGSIPNGKNNVQITYTHGYTETPVLIQELAALLGGMRALVNISGGSYKDVSTYSLGRKSFSIGQVYVNIESSIKQMKLRVQEITESLGYRFGCA